MGNISARDKVFFYAIQENNEALVRQMLQKYPELANTGLLNGTTTPLCRATYNGYSALVEMLLDHGADINQRALASTRTPLMWAAFRGKIDMMELLIARGANISLEDREGLNCFDIAVCRLQYDAAKFLYKTHGMWRTEEEREALYNARSDTELDQQQQYREQFDIDLFFLYLESDKQVENLDVFFEKIRREYEEWLKRDLVVDTRESWREWFHRQSVFGEAKLVPCEELEERYQPHASFYNKMVNKAAGIDITPRQKFTAQTMAVDVNSLEERKEVQDALPTQKVTIDYEAKSKPATALVDVKFDDNDEVDPIGFDDEHLYAAEMKDYTQTDNVEHSKR